MLEVGCGDGALTRALADAGYDALGIDPNAQEGPLVRAVALEDFEGGPFDAVVAVLSLHHVHDLGEALEKIASLAPLLVVDEFSRDRLDPPTVAWYEEQRRSLLQPGWSPWRPPADEWIAHLEGLHVVEDFRRELEPRFEERSFTWEPYLHRFLVSPALEPVERELIDAGAISATGFRYVGTRR